MRKLAIIMMFAVASMSAATAKTMHHSRSATGYSYSPYRGPGTAAMAKASSPDVYSYGEYLGTDPDLNIRAALLRGPRLDIR